jgi:hypothetical protein
MHARKLGDYSSSNDGGPRLTSALGELVNLSGGGGRKTGRHDGVVYGSLDINRQKYTARSRPHKPEK